MRAATLANTVSHTALVDFFVDGDTLPPSIKWSTGLPLHVPDELAQAIKCGSIEVDETTRVLAAKVAIELRIRAAFTPNSPLSSRLPAHYHNIPGPLRRALAHVVGRLQRQRQSRWARFPGWPIDLSADFAADLAGMPSITFKRTPVLLSHDIDTPEGLYNLVRMFLPLEEQADAVSTNFVVPCAWSVDPALVMEVKSRGHEIGVHGYDHRNRTPFCNATEREKRLSDGRVFGDQYGAIGYRSPSLLRTKALLTALEQNYTYDSSIPTSGGAFPVPNNGCASARPWRIGNIWEIPLTMPRDGSLRFLGYSPTQIGRMWRTVAVTVAQSGGIVSLLTHCEAGFSGNQPMLSAYRSFIEWIKADDRFEFMRMDKLAAVLEGTNAANFS